MSVKPTVDGTVIAFPFMVVTELDQSAQPLGDRGPLIAMWRHDHGPPRDPFPVGAPPASRKVVTRHVVGLDLGTYGESPLTLNKDDAAHATIEVERVFANSLELPA